MNEDLFINVFNLFSNMVGLKIKEIRERNNLSKEYVAIQMEMSINDYSKLEKEKVDLKLSKLDRLVKILGAKKSELFSLEY